MLNTKRSNEMSDKHIMEQLITLKGHSVYLKRLDVDMIDELSDAFMDMSFETKVLTTTAVVFNRSGIRNFVESIIKDSSRIDFAIYSVETNELIGDIALNDIDSRNMYCNIRVAIDNRKNYSKGYGREAMKLAMNYGFGMLNLNRIELDVLEVNSRAINVYEKLGFEREGLKRKACYYNYKYHNLVSMACLREDFINIHEDCLVDDLLNKENN